MDWYDYFPLGPGVNDDEEQDDIWSIWTFDGDDFLKMWLLAWGDHYEELFPVSVSEAFAPSISRNYLEGQRLFERRIRQPLTTHGDHGAPSKR
ncbi:hypothetical protein QR680_012795 [Steinernema hermaphroditum]|uniref:Uncharacterized protein n=1 Tax=Steinernema hermaphroditum TaxID=289476 RepID=A0AA39M167_9BILA|nr:hypothetical protein QR680_012795 [Steinernema hermaphroditum]